MHTSQQLKASLFEIRIDGRDSSLADLLPAWGPLDRFGIIAHEPFDCIGASHLLQATIVAFYDAVPGRRELAARMYPEVYVFHVGGRFGDYVNFDVFPSRKEVFLENDPAAVLNAINDRGITRLAVPDRVPEVVQHEWKEPAQALERISSAWAYSASGRVQNADLEITATSPLAHANTKMTLHSSGAFYERQEAKEALGDTIVPDDERLVMPYVSREAEVSSADRDRIRDERKDLDDERGRTETYRRIEVADALKMLHAGDAPAFVEQANFADLAKQLEES